MFTALILATTLALPAPQAAAEFDPQRAVWLSWPTYEHKKGVSIEKTTVEIVRELVKNVDVEMLVLDDKTAAKVRKLIPSNRLNLRKMPYSEIWMRDFGPYFITDGKTKTILDFGFNYWGYEASDSPLSVQHEQIDRLISKQLGVQTRRAWMIGEGGNREANGDGVAMLVEAVEQQRNPTLSMAEIDARLKAAMGVQKIIWLKEGLDEDGYSFQGPILGDVYMPVTTGGHVDTSPDL